MGRKPAKNACTHSPAKKARKVLPWPPMLPAKAKVMLSHSNLTGEQLAALGAVVVESTYLEIQVEHLIAALSGMSDARCAKFLDKAMMNAKLELLQELAEARLSPARMVHFATLISALKANNHERSVAVHGLWTRDSSQPGEAATRLRKNKRMSAGKLSTLAAKINSDYWALLEFQLRAWEMPKRARRAKRLHPKFWQ